jgi:hypothetical protein
MRTENLLDTCYVFQHVKLWCRYHAVNEHDAVYPLKP